MATPTTPPPSGLWRGWFISAQGFSRWVHFVLDIQGSKVTGTYSANLFHDGRQTIGTISGTFEGTAFALTASAPDLMGDAPNAFTLNLTFVDAPRVAAYGTVQGNDTYAPFSGVIRMRPAPAMPVAAMATGDGGWVDENPEQG